MQEQNYISKIKYVLASLLFAYVGVILLKIIINYAGHFFDFDFHIEQQSKKKSIIKLFLLTIIFAPVIEELIFRLHLKNKKINFIISLSLLIIIMLSLFFNGNIKNLDVVYYSSYLSYIVLVMYVSNKKFFKHNLFFVKTHLIINCIFFALFHITNYKIINYSDFHVYIINVIPMFIFGYYFSKIRLNLNIYWAIFAHMISNSIPFLLIVLRK